MIDEANAGGAGAVAGGAVVGGTVVGATRVDGTVVDGTSAGGGEVDGEGEGAAVADVAVAPAAPVLPVPQPAASRTSADREATVRRRYNPGTSSGDGHLTTAAEPTGRPRPVAGGAALVLGALLAGCGTVPAPAAAPPTAPLTAAGTTAPSLAPEVSTTTLPLATAPPPPATAPVSPATTAATAPTRAAAPAPVAAPPTAGAGCSASLAGQLAATGSATQVVTVEAAGYGTTAATVALWERDGSCWTSAGGPWPAVLGAAGFSDHHAEGDDTTPTGAYGIGPTMYGTAPNPGVRYSYHQLVCGDWWDEDPSSQAYNSFQHVGCGQRPPFGGGSEALWEDSSAYPSFAVVEYNTGPVVAGAGSGIFIHADIGSPTAGCVSLPLADLDALLRWLEPAAAPLVVMGPAGEITRF